MAMGRMSWKKTRIFEAPSKRAASSSSRGIFMKNWRRKKTAKGVMSMVGRATPSRESMRPSCLTSTKLGSRVKIEGTMREARKIPKTVFLPLHRKRAKEYAAIAEKKTTTDRKSVV